MSRAIRIYDEKMTAEELLFVTEMKRKESGVYFRVVRNLVFFFIIIPSAFSIIMEQYFKDDEAQKAAALLHLETPKNNVYVIIKVSIIIVFLFLIGAIIIYQRNLGKLVYDVKHKTKTIETSTIHRKQAIEAHQQYHFYITSPTKYSIEVNPEDYNRFKEGDEINIEYSSRAHVYFGYF